MAVNKNDLSFVYFIDAKYLNTYIQIVCTMCNHVTLHQQANLLNHIKCTTTSATFYVLIFLKAKVISICRQKKAIIVTINYKR